MEYPCLGMKIVKRFCKLIQQAIRMSHEYSLVDNMLVGRQLYMYIDIRMYLQLHK